MKISKIVKQGKRFRDRRRKLAEFLMSGDVVEDHFNLAYWIIGSKDFLAKAVSQKKVGCGTTACIAGMCPIVFPRSWTWVGTRPSLKELAAVTGQALCIDSFAVFFGLPYQVALKICVPSRSGGTSPYGTKLPSDVTAYEAGKVILSLNDPKLPKWV